MGYEYPEYMRAYRESLDAHCGALGVDAHSMKIFDKKNFAKVTAREINNSIVKMILDGKFFALNHPSEANKVMDSLELELPRSYFHRLRSPNTTISKKYPVAGPHEIVKDLYAAFNYGIHFSSTIDPKITKLSELHFKPNVVCKYVTR